MLAVALVPFASSATTTIGTNISTGGTLTVNGNTTIGDALTDTLTVTSSLLGGIYFEGLTTDDTYQTLLQVADPAAGDITITLPNVTGTVVTTGDTASVTGTMITDDTVVLTTDTAGNYVASVANGSGITGGSAGSEGAALTLALGALTADWTATTGIFDIILANNDSQLQIMGDDGTFYGTFNVDVLSSDTTYTFPEVGGTGTIITNANTSDILDLASVTVTTDLTIGESAAAVAITGHLSVTSVIDVADITKGTCSDLTTVGVTGAAVGDTVVLGAPATLEAELLPFGFVSAADTVTIRICNTNDDAGLNIDPGLATWRVDVWKH
ncbi:MAG: hypothetical protein AUJ19_02145 [Parcubacteria group bacterium CG1_02_58_44]|nr:MAG: hypothetical protein AUJ19_02145 [Parcubacteria group bacterium CG1_02_58_44]